MKETTFSKTVVISVNAPATTTTEEVLFVPPFAIKGEREVSTDLYAPLRLRVRKQVRRSLIGGENKFLQNKII